MSQAKRWIRHSAKGVDEETGSPKFMMSKVPLVRTFDRPHGPPQKIDLEFMSILPQVAQILADTFWMEMASMSDMTRSTRRANLKSLFTFLQINERNKVKSLQDFDFELLGAFSKWLTDEKGLSGLSSQTVYLSVTQLLRVARRLYPNEFKPDFEIPSYGLSPQRLRSSKGLAPEIFAEIIRAATSEASAIQASYSPGDFPTRGGDLFPFMILIATYTAMNPFSLYQLGRNCLEPHPIDNNGVYVTWKKARSSTGIQRQLHFKQTSQTISLINFVLEYTKPLIDRAGPRLCEFLLLYQVAPHFNPNKVRVTSMQAWANHLSSLRAFCKRNNLPHFTIGQIRPAAATQNHLMNGGNLRKTQMLLGHKDLATTILYIEKKTLKPLYDKSLRAAQEAMVNRITVVPKPTEEAIAEISTELSDAQRGTIAKGEFSTGIGRCRDPLNSPQPSQKKGQMCTLFLACITCSNSLYFLEDLPRVIALATHLRSLRTSMTKETWETLYGKHVQVLEDEIISAFSDQDIADARLKSLALSEMKLLMTNNIRR